MKDKYYDMLEIGLRKVQYLNAENLELKIENMELKAKNNELRKALKSISIHEAYGRGCYFIAREALKMERE